MRCISACLILALAFINKSQAMNLDLVYEGSCITPPVAKLDPKLMADDKVTWYYPMGSKYQLYRNAATFLQKDVNMVTDQDLETACVLIKLGKNPDCIAHGRRIPWESKMIGPASYEWKTLVNNMYGTCYVTLTDNKTFILTVARWENQHLGWNVMSKTKTLDGATKEKIIDHIKILGFDPKKIIENSYDKCEERDEL